MFTLESLTPVFFTSLTYEWFSYSETGHAVMARIGR